jgi:hypothetical protein
MLKNKINKFSKLLFVKGTEAERKSPQKKKLFETKLACEYCKK